jgi:alkaline phosphatase
VSRRLALVFGAYPDHCDAGKPHLDRENVPVPTVTDGSKQIAPEVYCPPGTARRVGNLPITANSGVHSADDVVLTAMGPGADVFRGHIDNTRVFHAMARALGLGAEAPPTGTAAATNGQSTSAR